jgi:hypothetical protein
MHRGCLLERGWGQGCQRLPNLGPGLHLNPRRHSPDLQKTLARAPGLAPRLHRRVSLTLYDMQ